MVYRVMLHNASEIDSYKRLSCIGNMAKIKKEHGNFGSYPGIRDQSEKYTYITPGNKGIFSRELGNKQKFKREQGNMYPPKQPPIMVDRWKIIHFSQRKI